MRGLGGTRVPRRCQTRGCGYDGQYAQSVRAPGLLLKKMEIAAHFDKHARVCSSGVEVRVPPWSRRTTASSSSIGSLVGALSAYYSWLGLVLVS
eukprot:1039420-Rhodomonas_salina.3